jgi:predicted dienelactone hydrolase
LVVFSHGFHGSSTQSTFLMRAIADDGFLVIAPNHQDAGRGRSFKPEAPLGRPSDWSDTTYLDRADDIRNLLKVLRNDPDWSRQIDWQRLALAGHSLGGYTVLGLAGGWPSWKLTGIKAVLALSPYSAPFQEHGDLASLGVPVMYQGGTRDIGITPFVARKGGAFDATSSPAWFVEFQGAGHLAWTDLNPRYHESVIHYSLAFLNRYVKGLGSTDMETRLPDVAELRSK